MGQGFMEYVQLRRPIRSHTLGNESFGKWQGQSHAMAVVVESYFKSVKYIGGRDRTPTGPLHAACQKLASHKFHCSCVPPHLRRVYIDTLVPRYFGRV